MQKRERRGRKRRGAIKKCNISDHGEIFYAINLLYTRTIVFGLRTRLAFGWYEFLFLTVHWDEL